MSETGTLTTSEVADVLHVSVRQVNRLIKRNELTPIKKLPGKYGTYLFDASAIQEQADARA